MDKFFSDSNADGRDEMAVTAFMKELASLSVSEKPLPDPTYLWWKAELLRRWDAQQKATAPIEVGEQVQVGVGLVAAAGLLIWLWRTIPGLAAPSASLTVTSLTSLTTVLIVSALLVAGTASAMVRDLLRRQ